MLADTDVLATIAVKKLDAARAFYEGKLGLEPLDADQPGTATYTSGKTKLLVYESEFAGTNRATAATWIVGDQVDNIVKTLKSKGVGFEHYDMPGTTLEGDVHVGYGMRVAWCKDPDGNILAFVSG
jgi:catechol 2,3-dioxygenase-like lactoylglutathione lyase family enzyme